MEFSSLDRLFLFFTNNSFLTLSDMGAIENNFIFWKEISLSKRVRCSSKKLVLCKDPFEFHFHLKTIDSIPPLV